MKPQPLPRPETPIPPPAPTGSRMPPLPPLSSEIKQKMFDMWLRGEIARVLAEDMPEWPEEIEA